jgi:heme-degrading monooxygenase HmoA
MFARRVSLNLKDAKSAPELTRRLQNKVIPLLREQQGFKDEITFVAPGGTEAFAISLWDKKESADAYTRETYPEVLKVLAGVVEDNPRVETYEVANSTFHHLAVTS